MCGCFQAFNLFVTCPEVHGIASSQLLFLVRFQFNKSSGDFMPFCWWWIHHRLELGKNESSRRTRGGSVAMEWHSQHAAASRLNECVSLTVINGILGNGLLLAFFLRLSKLEHAATFCLSRESVSPYNSQQVTLHIEVSRSLGDVVTSLAGKGGCTKRDSGTWAALPGSFLHPHPPVPHPIWPFRFWQDCAEGVWDLPGALPYNLSEVAALMRLEMKT